VIIHSKSWEDAYVAEEVALHFQNGRRQVGLVDVVKTTIDALLPPDDAHISNSSPFSTATGCR